MNLPRHPILIAPQALRHITELIRRDGIDTRLNWYKTFVRGIGTEDKGAWSCLRIGLDAHPITFLPDIPDANLEIAQPVLYVACQRDYACAPALSKATIRKHCKNVTIKEFDTGHWVQLEASDVFNASLLEWISGFNDAV